MKDYYAILEVTPEATQDEIKEKYHFLANLWHPDKHQNPKHKILAEQKLYEINEAFEILGKADKRKNYDRIWQNNRNFHRDYRYAEATEPYRSNDTSTRYRQEDKPRQSEPNRQQEVREQKKNKQQGSNKTLSTLFIFIVITMVMININPINTFLLNLRNNFLNMYELPNNNTLITTPISITSTVSSRIQSTLVQYSIQSTPIPDLIIPTVILSPTPWPTLIPFPEQSRKLIGTVVCPGSTYDKRPVQVFSEPDFGSYISGEMLTCATVLETTDDGLFLRIDKGWAARFNVKASGNK